MSDLTSSLDLTKPTIKWLMFCYNLITDVNDRKLDLEHIDISDLAITIDHLQINMVYNLHNYIIELNADSKNCLWKYIVYSWSVGIKAKTFEAEPKWDYWFTALLSAYKAIGDYEKGV